MILVENLIMLNSRDPFLTTRIPELDKIDLGRNQQVTNANKFQIEKSVCLNSDLESAIQTNRQESYKKREFKYVHI